MRTNCLRERPLLIVFLALALLGPSAAWADEEILEFPCILTGLPHGRLRVDVNAERFVLLDGKKAVARGTAWLRQHPSEGDIVCSGQTIDITVESLLTGRTQSLTLERHGGRLVKTKDDLSFPACESELQEAEKHLKQGAIKQAVEVLLAIQYPQRCFSRDEWGQKVLRRAQTVATQNYRARQPAQAAAALAAAFAYTEVFPLDEKLPIMVLSKNDYGFYLSESGKLPEAEQALRQVLEVAPERAVAHLNLADVLWALGRPIEARAEYAAYAVRVAPARWPSQVRERCPACKVTQAH